MYMHDVQTRTEVTTKSLDFRMHDIVSTCIANTRSQLDLNTKIYKHAHQEEYLEAGGDFLVSHLQDVGNVWS